MESSTKDTLSKRLVQLRTERGWTQSDLVEKMYLSQRTISHIEKGDCTLSNLIQLADLYEGLSIRAIARMLNPWVGKTLDNSRSSMLK